MIPPSTCPRCGAEEYEDRRMASRLWYMCESMQVAGEFRQSELCKLRAAFSRGARAMRAAIVRDLWGTGFLQARLIATEVPEPEYCEEGTNA